MKPVDNAVSLWRSPILRARQCVAGHVNPLIRRAELTCSGRVRTDLLQVEKPGSTFTNEGHPRGNGDGPLPTDRSSTTKGG